jgi:hypothetical protein
MSSLERKYRSSLSRSALIESLKGADASVQAPDTAVANRHVATRAVRVKVIMPLLVKPQPHTVGMTIDIEIPRVAFVHDLDQAVVILPTGRMPVVSCRPPGLVG